MGLPSRREFQSCSSKRMRSIPPASAPAEAAAPIGVSSDGKRFLVLAATDEKAPSAPIDVVVNWR